MEDTGLSVYAGQAIEKPGSLLAIISSAEMQQQLSKFSVSDAEIGKYKEGFGDSVEADKKAYRQRTNILARAGKQVLRVFGRKPYEPTSKTLSLDLAVFTAEHLQKSVKACLDLPEKIAYLQEQYAELSAQKGALEKQLSGLRDFLSGGAVKTLTLADRLRNYGALSDDERKEAAADAAKRCGYDIDVLDASVRQLYVQHLITECLAEEQRVRFDFQIAMGNYHSVERQLGMIEERGTKLIMHEIPKGLEDLRALQEIYGKAQVESILTITEMDMAAISRARAEAEARAKRVQERRVDEEIKAESAAEAQAVVECRVPEDKVHLSASDMCAEIDAVLGKPREELVVIDSETGLEEVVTVGR